MTRGLIGAPALLSGRLAQGVDYPSTTVGTISGLRPVAFRM